MAWSTWSECDDQGLQLRSRVCGAQSTQCVGNGTQHRDCNEIPGERKRPGLVVTQGRCHIQGRVKYNKGTQ